MHRYRALRSSLLFIAVPVWVSDASADQQYVFITVDGCKDADVSIPRFLEMTRAEIAPRILAVGAAAKESQAISAQVLLCQGSPQIARLVLTLRTQHIAERVVDLSDVVGELRARTLAVTLAEMLIASRAVTTAIPGAQVAPAAPASSAISGPQVAPAAPASSSEPVPESELPTKTRSAAPAPLAVTARANSAPGTVTSPKAKEPGALPRGLEAQGRGAPRNAFRVPRSRLAAGIALREFVAPSSPLVGPWVGVNHGRSAAELQILTLNRQMSLGTVDLYNVNLAASYDLLATTQPAVLALRARAELGLTWAKGAPGDPLSGRGRTTSNFQGATLLELGFISPLASRLGLDCRLSAGVARGVVATSDGKSIASTDGFLVGGALGLYWGLSDS